MPNKKYKSKDGCCICKIKQSSSRFSKRSKINSVHLKSLKLDSEDICNACVLFIRRKGGAKTKEAGANSNAAQANSCNADGSNQNEAGSNLPPPPAPLPANSGGGHVMKTRSKIQHDQSNSNITANNTGGGIAMGLRNAGGVAATSLTAAATSAAGLVLTSFCSNPHHHESSPITAAALLDDVRDCSVSYATPQMTSAASLLARGANAAANSAFTSSTNQIASRNWLDAMEEDSLCSSSVLVMPAHQHHRAANHHHHNQQHSHHLSSSSSTSSFAAATPNTASSSSCCSSSSFACCHPHQQHHHHHVTSHAHSANHASKRRVRQSPVKMPSKEETGNLIWQEILEKKSSEANFEPHFAIQKHLRLRNRTIAIDSSSVCSSSVQASFTIGDDSNSQHANGRFCENNF